MKTSQKLGGVMLLLLTSACSAQAAGKEPAKLGEALQLAQKLAQKLAQEQLAK